MPLHKVTIKERKLIGNNMFLEKGMSVQFITNYSMNPILVNNGQDVVDAFMRVYGVDLRAADALYTAYLDTQIIG